MRNNIYFCTFVLLLMHHAKNLGNQVHRPGPNPHFIMLFMPSFVDVKIQPNKYYTMN